MSDEHQTRRQAREGSGARRQAPSSRRQAREASGKVIPPAPKPLTPAEEKKTLWGGGIALLVIAGIIVAIVLGVKAASSGSDDLAEKAHAEIMKAGAYGFGSYNNYLGTKADGANAIAIRTSLYPKAENETHGKSMCMSMQTVRLNNDLGSLKHVRVLASDETTLVYCD